MNDMVLDILFYVNFIESLIASCALFVSPAVLCVFNC